MRVYPLRNRLVRFAARILKNVQNAEDAVHDVLLNFLTSRKNPDSYGNIEAAAIRAVRNRCIDLMNRDVINAELLKSYAMEVYHNYNNTPVNMVVVKKIREIIVTLTPDQQNTFNLFVVEGLKYHEIAAALDMNENTVRINLFRARNKIREKLLNDDQYAI